MWIVPSQLKTSFLCAQELEDSKEDFHVLPYQYERSAMWRSKPLSWQIWLRKWKSVYWMRRLFGLTLKPSMENLFVEWYTGSVLVTHVNRFPMPENAVALKMKDTFSRIYLNRLKVIGPEFVYFENVGGHLSMGYDEVRRSLSDIGYRVEEGIFTAEEVGAPHRRERLFILGVMENASILRWRRWCIGNQGRIGCEVQVEGSGTSLGDTESYNESDDRISGQAGPFKDRRSGHKLDDSTNAGLSIAGQNGVGQYESQNSEQLLDRPKQSSIVMDNSFQSRLEGHAGNDRGAVGRKRQERSITPPGLFPAGQGAYQHDWEEPRTVESSLVYTINGYNFTEDLHRAIGNSVVEQVAELAFITLLDKHIKNS